MFDTSESMDQTTKSRHVVNHYSYENCAPLFDALKGEAKFFESEADFQMKIVKQTNRAYPDLKWKPAMIKGEHWIPALMNTMWRFRFDVITHRNFFEKDGLNADEGVLNLVSNKYNQSICNKNFGNISIISVYYYLHRLLRSALSYRNMISPRSISVFVKSSPIHCNNPGTFG